MAMIKLFTKKRIKSAPNQQQQAELPYYGDSKMHVLYLQQRQRGVIVLIAYFHEAM